MDITIKLGEPLWRVVGQRRLRLSWPDDAPPTAADLLAHLEATYAGFAAALASAPGISHQQPYQFFIDSRLVSAQALSTRRLQAGETLYIFLPAAGGQDATVALPRAFYARATPTVARDLLGQMLARTLPNGQRFYGRIVETEAYGGAEDLASHAARGPTPRAAVMFGEPGRAYIYFIYGMYFCFNVVTEADGTPGAVLVRALQPAAENGSAPPDQPWPRLDGPGKLCRALHIDRTWNGHDLTQPGHLFIAPGPPAPDSAVTTTPRINVRADAWGLAVPWRFVLRQHRAI